MLNQLNNDLQHLQQKQNQQNEQIDTLTLRLNEIIDNFKLKNKQYSSDEIVKIFAKLSPHCFGIITSFLPLKEKLNLRLVSKQFWCNIMNCFPIYIQLENKKLDQINVELQQYQELSEAENEQLAQQILQARQPVTQMPNLRAHIQECKSFGCAPELDQQMVYLASKINIGKDKDTWKETQQAMNNIQLFSDQISQLNIFEMNQPQLKLLETILTHTEQEFASQNSFSASIYRYLSLLNQVLSSPLGQHKRIRMVLVEKQKNIEKLRNFFEKVLKRHN